MENINVRGGFKNILLNTNVNVRGGFKNILLNTNEM